MSEFFMIYMKGFEQFNIAILIACIGFWGKNCANPCSVGFYGHGCRQKCSCDPTQFCDSALGCITRPGGMIHLHVSMKIPVSAII